MFLIAITLLLILVGVAAFVYGTIALSKFAFRISTGRGVAALLFPPYTLYFAFSELQEEEKNIPAAAWVFGFLVTTLLVAVFSTPLSHLAAGRWDKLEATSPGEVASKEYGDKEESGGEEEQSDEESSGDSEGADDESSDSDSEKKEESKDENEESSKDEKEKKEGDGEKKDEENKDKDDGEKSGGSKDE